MKKHVAASGAKAGQWVNCSATGKCRNTSVHISEKKLYAIYGWRKSEIPSLKLKDVTEKDALDFVSLKGSSVWDDKAEELARVTKGIKNPLVDPFERNVFVSASVEKVADVPVVVVSGGVGQRSLVNRIFSSFLGKKKVLKDISPKSGEVQLGSDNRLSVVARNPWRDVEDVYMFGDETSLVEAQRLHAADVDKRFVEGDCGVLAGELWNSNPHVEGYYFLKTDDEPVIGIHHFVKLKDGTFADSLGIWSESELVANWREQDSSVVLTLVPEDDGGKNPNIVPQNVELFNELSSIINKRFI